MPRRRVRAEDVELDEVEQDGDEYVEDDFSQEVSEKLVVKYPGNLGHINLEQVGFVRKRCKRKTKGKIVYANCRAVKQPVRMFARCAWIITTMGENFTSLSLPVKQRVVYHELLHIAREEGGVNDHDVQDFSFCVNEWGVNWGNDNEAELLVPMEDETPAPIDEGGDGFIRED